MGLIYFLVSVGSWSEFLRMREVVLQKNNEFKQHFSNDLGAIGGFLFEVGVQNILIENATLLDDTVKEKLLKQISKRHQEVISEQKRGNPKIVCAFEVEKSTSIYSGILRLSDMAFSLPDHQSSLYIVTPDAREKEVKIQLSRPSIRNLETPIKYILMSELRTHCDALCKLGDSYRIMDKIVM
jgi:hypothetical protein